MLAINIKPFYNKSEMWSEIHMNLKLLLGDSRGNTTLDQRRTRDNFQSHPLCVWWRWGRGNACYKYSYKHATCNHT